MNNKFLLQDLTDQLSDKGKLKKKEADEFLKAFFQVIEESLFEGEVVKIPGLGTFKLLQVDSRKSVNVTTGQEIEIKEHYKVSFTPDSGLKEVVNIPFSHLEPVELDSKPEIKKPVENDYFSGRNKVYDQEAFAERAKAFESEAYTDKYKPQVTKVSREESVTPTRNQIESPVDNYRDVVKEDTEDFRKRSDDSWRSSDDSGRQSDHFRKHSDENRRMDEPRRTDDSRRGPEDYSRRNSEDFRRTPDEPRRHSDESRKHSDEYKRHSERSAEESRRTYNDTKKHSDETRDARKQTHDTKRGTKPSHKPTYPTQGKPIWLLVAIVAAILAIWALKSNRDAKKDKEFKLQEMQLDTTAFEETKPEELMPKIKDSLKLEDKIETELKAMKVAEKTDKPEKPADQTDLKETVKPDVKTPVRKNTSVAKEPEKTVETVTGVTFPVTVTMAKGDRLTLLALKYYGHKAFWVYIYLANKNLIADPDHIPLGTKLRIPKPEPSRINANDPKCIAKAKAIQTKIMSM